MCIVHFFKTLFKNKKSSNNNEDEFDWEAYEKAVADHPLHQVFECRKKSCLNTASLDYTIVLMHSSSKTSISRR